MKRLLGKIIDTLSSVALTIALFASLACASSLGALLPQGLRGAEYAARYGGGMTRVIFFWGLNDLYHSWWFVSILVLIGINLLVCSIRRVAARRWSWGFLVTHLSLLVILGGAVITASMGERGIIELSEGQATDSFYTSQGRKNLGFAVYLESFNVEWDLSAAHRISAMIRDQGVRSVSDVQVGSAYRIDGTPYSLEVEDFLPHFSIDEQGNIGSRGPSPTNPALLVKVSDGRQSEERWLFANFPYLVRAKDENIDLVYKWAGAIKSFQSRLKVFDNHRDALTGTVEVNAPLKYKGYAFYQAQYDVSRPDWTGLLVVRDPGSGVVFAGLALLNLGIVMMFGQRFFKRRRCGLSENVRGAGPS